MKLCAHNFKALRELECPSEGALFGFLRVVATNVAQDHRRGALSQKRGQGIGEEDLEKAYLYLGTGDLFRRQVEREILLKEIGELLADQCRDSRMVRDRMIFWLYYKVGYSAREIAALPNLHLSVKGVESTLQRMIQQIREKLFSEPGACTGLRS